jgi:Putative 2OG-Fe(II) oxygenase
MNNFEEYRIYNPGITIGKVPDSLLLKLKEISKSAEAKVVPYNDKLAGAIKDEYEMPDLEEFRDFLSDMYQHWRKLFRVPNTPYNYQIWINFMKKNEFNPTHIHYGLASFVVWVDIPYDIKQELDVEYLKNNIESKPRNSCFEFIYTMLDGQIKQHTIEVDTNYEGTIIMFPSNLMHQVYPFSTSDGVRVSIAGNIKEARV